MRLGWVLMIATLTGCDAIFDLEKVSFTPDPQKPPCEPLDVDTGRSHTCAVDYRGEVRCWGENFDGEVLPGAAGVVLQPLQVVLPAPAAQVAVGKHYSCARLVDGAVWCWGGNESNELALGVDVESDVPVAITGLPPSAEISGGGYHVCSRSADDGTIWCWGNNEEGESGQATSALDCDPNSADGGCQMPTAVPNSAGSKAIALGHRFSCAINAEDRVLCWGYNTGGQLTLDPNETEFTATPTVIAQLGAASAIAASGRTVCATEASGTVRCWGTGSEGQLATGMFAAALSPPVGTLVENASSLALGNGGGCAVLRDGSVQCWGNNDGGTGTFTTTPTPQTALVTNASQVSGHFFHTCAIANGELLCWGVNADAQLGRGTQSIAKTAVTTIASGATQVAAGQNHACAIVSGELYCWGDNDFGQAGDPNLVRTYVPTKRTTGVQLIGLDAGFDQTCVWGAGAAECWGRAWVGRLGTGVDQRSQERSPVQATGVDHIAIGGDHLCALLQNNTIRCFGYNGRGQVGLAPGMADRSLTGNTVSNPNGVLGTIYQIDAGGRHNCARTSTGVWCWGYGDRGQLGNGSRNDQHVPVQVTGMIATDIALGEDFSCAIEISTGDVYCWGSNGNGQLGINSIAHQSSRVKVMNLPAKALRIYSGTRTSSVCARLETGAVYCWGDGDFGQLANGILTDQRLPSLAPGFATATSIAVGSVGNCAVVGSEVKCVGEWRLLGNGDQSLSMPTAVNLGTGACPLD